MRDSDYNKLSTATTNYSWERQLERNVNDEGKAWGAPCTKRRDGAFSDNIAPDMKNTEKTGESENYVREPCGIAWRERKYESEDSRWGYRTS